MADIGSHSIHVQSKKWWDRSALGMPTKEGLTLGPVDILYCHLHRGMKLPSSNWFEDILEIRPTIISECLVDQALRSPGNKVVWYDHFDDISHEHSKNSTALRWDSNKHPSKFSPDAEVRWFHSRTEFDASDLLNWSDEVNQSGRIAEVMVVDDDLDVVCYRVKEIDPSGVFDSTRQDTENSIKIDSGTSWSKGEQLNNQHPSFLNGVLLDEHHSDLPVYSEGSMVYEDLLERRLFVKSGFKYGVRWRAYENGSYDGHAPWLVCHPDAIPTNWISACQGSRLASGVSKTMLLPILDGTRIRYLAVLRPPSNSRWNSVRR